DLSSMLIRLATFYITAIRKVSLKQLLVLSRWQNVSYFHFTVPSGPRFVIALPRFSGTMAVFLRGIRMARLLAALFVLGVATPVFADEVTALLYLPDGALVA